MTDVRILKNMGEGTFGKVFLVSTNSGEKLIMKEINYITEKEKRSADSEIAILRDISLNCREYLSCYRSSEVIGNKMRIFTDYIENSVSLKQFYHEQKDVSLPDQFRIMEDLLKGLIVLHNSGVVHRDIKPANILIIKDPRTDNLKTDLGSVIRYIDYGGSCATEEQCNNIYSGSRKYAPPEIFTRPKMNMRNWQRVDIWSLGVVFFFIVSKGQFLVNTNNLSQIISKNQQFVNNIVYQSIASIRGMFPHFINTTITPETAKDLLLPFLQVENDNRKSLEDLDKNLQKIKKDVLNSRPNLPIVQEEMDVDDGDGFVEVEEDDGFVEVIDVLEHTKSDSWIEVPVVEDNLSEIPKYTVLKTLGAGTFGTASLVEMRDGRKMVLKISKIYSERTRKIVENEIDILLKIKGDCEKYLLCIDSAYFDRANAYIFLPYVEDSKDLYAYRFETETFMHWKAKLYAIMILARGLSKLHDLDVVHRDIKPSNILVVGNARMFKYIDYGLACTRNSQVCNTPTGTIAFFSPELAQAYLNHINNRPTRLFTFEELKKQDIWALGITLLEICFVPKDNFWYVEAEYISKLTQKSMDDIIDTKVETCIFNYPAKCFEYSYEIKNILKLMLRVNPRERNSANHVFEMTSQLIEQSKQA